MGISSAPAFGGDGADQPGQALIKTIRQQHFGSLRDRGPDELRLRDAGGLGRLAQLGLELRVEANTLHRGDRITIVINMYYT